MTTSIALRYVYTNGPLQTFATPGSHTVAREMQRLSKIAYISATI